MTASPLSFPCPHLATPQEMDRDPQYEACNAAAGQPCVWARRYDGQPDPPFHSERLEQLLNASDHSDTPVDPNLQQAILDTGLV